MTDYKLWYYIEGQPEPHFLQIAPNQTIADLKQVIHDREFYTFKLLECDARELILKKVTVDRRVIEDHVRRGQYRPNLNYPSLYSGGIISEVWSQQPPKSELHIFVSPPGEKASPRSLYSDQHLSKRQRLNDDSKAGPEMLDTMKRFWESLWRDKQDPFSTVPVLRDSNPIEGVDVPSSMKVLHIPTVLSPISDIMIREEYGEAIKAIEGHYMSKKPKNGVVVVGHPGIGKTTLLYYILVNRLLAHQQTILQCDADALFLFDANGVTEMAPTSYRNPELVTNQNTWALVDCNEDVSKPARILSRSTSPFFLVIASSPRASRWQNVLRYRGRIALWFMKPFTLAELIQARQLQTGASEESAIENFFEKYGPSARDCYDNCHDDDALKLYHAEVQRKVKETRWDLLTQIITSGPRSLEIDQISHIILLIQPHPDNRSFPNMSIVTKTVSQLLWDQDSIYQWRNHRQIFTTLHKEANAKSFCGTIFEPPFHALCARGAEFEIHPMTCTLKSVNYRCTHEKSQGKETLVLGPQKQCWFRPSEKDKNNSIKKLLGNHYYRPIATNHPSIDSFIYDPVSRQISAFQITLAENHDLKPTGVEDLHELGKRLKINLSIRIIVAVLEGSNVSLTVKKELYDKLGLKVYALEVTLDQLYNF